MLQKKICTLGADAVGKTSLLSRFVKRLFSEKYLTTIGVKVDKKTVQVGGDEVMLMLWDLAGEDEYQQLRMSYLRGASGYLLVVDRTRPQTLATALSLKQRVDREIGELPMIMVLNKSDLLDELKINRSDIEKMALRGSEVFETSAKSGAGVEDAFLSLTKKLIRP